MIVMLLREIASLVAQCAKTIIRVESNRLASMNKFAKDMNRLHAGEVKTLTICMNANRRTAEIARLALLNSLGGDEALAKAALEEATKQHRDGIKWF